MQLQRKTASDTQRPFAPINRLPFEILLHVFASASDHVPVGPTLGCWWSDTRFWTLMAVCRHWRDLIVGTPTLWSTLDLRKNTHWTELCLARSVAIPINVCARVQDLRLNRFRAVYTHVHRIRSLVFYEPRRLIGDLGPDLLAALKRLFGNGMHVLESLDFAISNDRRSYKIYRSPIDIELTAERFPLLRSVALAGVVVPQDPSLYAHLQGLSLKACTYTLSFDGFLDALDSCTRLKSLRLEATLHHLSGNWKQWDPSLRQRPLVSFPHLNQLVLLAHGATHTSRFLAHVHIPQSAQLIISATAEHADLHTLDGTGTIMMAAMLPADPTSTLEPLATVQVVHMCMGTNWTRIATASAPGVVPNVHLQMSVNPWILPNPFAVSQWASVRDLAGLAWCASLTSLSVSDLRCDTVAAWVAIFRAFPCLKQLSVYGLGPTCDAAAVRNVFLGLHTASESESLSVYTPQHRLDQSPYSTVACPELADVSVSADRVEITGVYQAMRTCFLLRRDRGAVLGELKLDFMVYNLSAALCRACLKDIMDCTKQLSLRGVRLDDNEEDECVGLVRISEQGHSPEDSRQAMVSNAEAYSGWNSPVLIVGRDSISLNRLFNRLFKTVGRLAEKFRRNQ